MTSDQTLRPPSTEPRRPLVLGIESSCDDTACAVLDGEGRVLASVVSSQLAAHLEYGGVVPEIASREHLRNWPAVNAKALAVAGIELADIDAVAATRGPGLVGSLLVGLSVGKAIAYGLSKPFFGVHHLEGHLYSPFLVPPPKPGANTNNDGAPSGIDETAGGALSIPARCIGLVVSGGHTALYEVDTKSPVSGDGRGTQVNTVAETRDDAMGECFDKVGKRLGLPFPGGPIVDQLAELGALQRGKAQIPASEGTEQRELFFRTPRCGDTLDFSYSGLKTQAIVETERLERAGFELDPHELLRLSQLVAESGDLAAAQAAAAASSQYPAVQLLAAFRDAAVRQVLDRLSRYYRSTPSAPADLAVSGGVAANRALRRSLAEWGAQHSVRVHLVPLAFCGDNAAMIAHAALRRLRQGESGDPLTTDAQSRLPVG